MAYDFSALQSSISTALLATTRNASALASEDLSFHRSLDPSLATRLDEQNARLLDLATGLLGTATATSETVRPPPSLRDIEGIENNWRAVVDVVDSLLERADTALDEFTGAVKRMSPGVEAQVRILNGKAARSAMLIGQSAGARTPKTSKIAMQLKSLDMKKPQYSFEHVPTNQEQRPFKPLLLSKPHASIALETEPTGLDDSDQLQYDYRLSIHSHCGIDHKFLPRTMRSHQKMVKISNCGTRYPHPYQLEIEQYQYPASLYSKVDPIPYHPFDSTAAIFVDTEDKLTQMLEELKQAKEIAIDLEHHDQRSYIGIVSLMQISTRDQDYIVDTLKPWRRKIQILNEVFADPNIIKVLHGAYMDVVWLQRDLGLYLVGLFDTHYASRALGYAGGSLAFLLKKFVNVDAQKQYQMADWRIRPLPQELLDYARSDTHYLLYIFDCMRNELIQRSNLMLPDHEGDKLWDVLQQSSEVALQRYEHPVYDMELGQGNGGWYKMLSRTPALFTNEQFAVFRGVHQWRDNIAREQDDSVHYVMPNHQIFSIAREMPVKRETLIGVAQPVTQTVRLRADELLSVIINAKEAGKDGPEMLAVLNKVEPHTSTGVVKREPPSHSVAAFLQKPTAAAQPLGLQNPSETALPLRSATSAFWGGSFESSAHQQGKRTMSTATRPIQLSVPMPALTAEVFADPADVSMMSSTNGSPRAPEQESTPAAATEEDDDVFVLRDMGKKRKHQSIDAITQPSDGIAAQHDEVAIPDDEEERLREKAERKRARKEAKRAAKQAQQGTENGGDAGYSLTSGGQTEEEEPYDYTSAPSILNPPRETKDQIKERRKKEVNPYAKALDTAKGLPRVQKEKAGRSMTFK